MPFKACPPNLPKASPNPGAGPDRNILMPWAILSTKRGLRRIKAPPRCFLFLRRRRWTAMVLRV